jgi:serine/threonine protein phosphatase PrpC
VSITVVPEQPTSERPIPAPRSGQLSWASSSLRGPRRHQADATAAFRSPRTGRRAFAVADGVGDSEEAAFAAALAADHAVRVAALEGRAAAGVAAAGDVLRATGELATGDAALVVALEPGGGTRAWEIAWVGDCRALAQDGHGVQRRLTRDHTVAAAMRATGLRPARRLDHVLMTSVRTAKHSEVGVTRAESPAALLLVSDGVHRTLPPHELTGGHDLRDPLDRHGRGPADPRLWAPALTTAAIDAGGRDNATALVIVCAGSARM